MRVVQPVVGLGEPGLQLGLLLLSLDLAALGLDGGAHGGQLGLLLARQPPALVLVHDRRHRCGQQLLDLPRRFTTRWQHSRCDLQKDRTARATSRLAASSSCLAAINNPGFVNDASKLRVEPLLDLTSVSHFSDAFAGRP
jgi:hypothetical protein